MLKQYTVVLLFLFSLQLTAQELNCRIQINSQQIKGTNRQKFTSMRTSIYEFMNTTRWTPGIYSNEERIECNIILNLSSEVGANGYKGSITIKEHLTTLQCLILLITTLALNM